MQADTRISDICVKILPDINAATTQAQQAWCPALRDDALRRDIFARPSLATFVMDDLLATTEPTETDKKVPDNVLDALDFVVTEEPARIVTVAGLVWHANQLAKLISSGAIAIPDTGWDIADVRFALGLRAHSKAPDVAAQNFFDAVTSSGRACLSAWLNTAPNAIKGALDLSAGVLGDAFRDANSSDEKANVVSVCMAKLATAS